MIFTDASAKGWCAHLGDSQIAGVWTHPERKLHINVLHALLRSVSAFRLRTYVIADQLSRPNQSITTEWSLHPEVVNLIFKLCGTPIVDMFAAVHNMYLPQFMSPVPEPRALAIDALSQDWQGRSMYMVASQPWFPHLLHMSVDHPCFFPYDISRAASRTICTHGGPHAALPSSRIFKRGLSDIIMSIELQRPRLTPVLLQLDLGIVLEALRKPPYEPLREASLKHLTLKTVFLLAMV